MLAKFLNPSNGGQLAIKMFVSYSCNPLRCGCCYHPYHAFQLLFLRAPPQVTGRLLAVVCACTLSMHSFALRLLLRISSCNLCISSGPTGASFDKHRSYHLALPCRSPVSRTTPLDNLRRLISTACYKHCILLFRCVALFPTASHRTCGMRPPCFLGCCPWSCALHQYVWDSCCQKRLRSPEVAFVCFQIGVLHCSV